MTSLRNRKADVARLLLGRRMYSAQEDQLWDRMPPIGREFGSPDFEPLMDEDRRSGVGVFDPALKGGFLEDVPIPEDARVKRKRKPSASAS